MRVLLLLIYLVEVLFAVWDLQVNIRQSDGLCTAWEGASQLNAGHAGAVALMCLQFQQYLTVIGGS